MRSVAAVLVALFAGLGGGVALGNAGVLAVALGLASEAQASEEVADTRLRVTDLVEVPGAWTPKHRKRAAQIVDGHLVATGNEVFVRARGPNSTTLEIRTSSGATSRVKAYRFALTFRWQPLADAGFQKLVVTDGRTTWGFRVAETVNEGRILGPLPASQLE